MLRKLKPEFGTLEKIKDYIQTKDPSLKCTIEVDQWVDTLVSAANKCLVIKQSATAGAKIVMVQPGVVDIEGIAPSSFINSIRRGILAVIINMALSSSQNKVANQVDDWMKEIEN